MSTTEGTGDHRGKRFTDEDSSVSLCAPCDKSANRKSAMGNWLSDMDSNHDKGLQRALCYHYTIGQTDYILIFKWPLRKAKIVVVCAFE